MVGGVAFWQTVVVPEIDAVGNGLTVIVIGSDAVHPPTELVAVKVYVVVTVGETVGVSVVELVMLLVGNHTNVGAGV